MEYLANFIRRRIGVITLAVIASFGTAACSSGSDATEEEPDVGDEADAVANQEDSDVGEEGGEDVGGDEDASAEEDAGGDEEDADVGDDEPELDEVELAADGEAKLTIVVGENADSSVTQTAEELADMLGQISGAEFSVESGDGTEGLVLGMPGDFDAPPIDDVAFGDDTFEQEHYVIRSTEDNLFILGASSVAVQFAMWDLLYQLGHRQFFPTETWEVVPQEEQLSVAIDVVEEPDYFNRQGPRGAMRMDQRPWAEQAWEDWQLRNRTTATFELSTGHIYDSVVANNQSAFDNNPEYWGLVDGQRTSDAQPNVAHEVVQQMFIDHALSQFNSNPDRDSVAMDPRDGNQWSESPESLEIGGPSEQAINLANLVAEAVVDEYGDNKYVGIYGYSHHSPPPEIDAHPNVIVSLATEYIRGGYTFEEMIDGWSERSNMIGIREYYGIWNWHFSLPGTGASAGDTEYLQETIPHFHARGARFMNAESNDTWGGYGLGYYLAARMMWDVEEADRMDEIIDDFLQKAFGPAQEPMAEFYELIDGSTVDPYAPHRSRPLNDDMVGRMYRNLDEARELAGDDDEIRARIDDLILYTHYVELFRHFDEIEGPDRQEAFDDLVSFAWRSRGTMMAESVELVRGINRQVNQDDNLQWGSGRTTVVPSDNHRVDEDVPFTDEEIVEILEAGIANHDLLELDFEPWEDSGELDVAGFAAAERGTTDGGINRGTMRARVHTEDGTLPELTIAAGHIYDNLGPLRWTLRDEDGSVVDEGEIEPNEQDHHVDLSASEPGIYQFSITNGSQGYIWTYEPRGSKMTILAGGENELRRNWYDELYYYVPEGTEDIFIAGTLLEGRHEFVDGDGEAVEAGLIEEIQGFTRVPVPEGQDGSVWSLSLIALRPAIRFLNIPGYVALSPDELLLPEEVVEELP